MAGDFLTVTSSFSKTTELVSEYAARLNEQLAVLKAKGDTVQVAQVEAQLAALKRLSPGGGLAEIDASVAALRKEQEVLARNLEISVENLQVLRLQAEQLRAMEALNRGALAPRVIIPPQPTHAYSSYGQTAGAQSEVGRINQLLAEQNALRDQGIALEARQLEEDKARAAEMAKQSALLDAQLAANERAYRAGAQAGLSGGLVPGSQRAGLSQPPAGAGLAAGEWTKDNAALARYNVTLGEYDALSNSTATSIERVNVELTRLGIAEAQASNQMRAHGALTTEYLGALARGETTLSEFGYQLGATIAKFSGWAVAAAATYAAFGAVTEFGKGAIDAASGVQQLTRTIEGLDRNKASAAIQGLSQDVNVPIKEAADAVFAYSRTFHNLDDAVTAARLGLSVFKLDNVSVADSVKAATAISQQYGTGAQGLKSVFDELAASQREYNARISDMIPLLTRSSGAVKNAGGDLTQLIQIGAFMQRVTQQGGSQIGTALYRSAANFFNPHTTQGAKDVTFAKSIGIDVDHGYTEAIRSALSKSLTLSAAERSQLYIAIFGKQYGGRLAAAFNPQNIPLFEQISGQRGDPRKAITPAGTQGSLDKELQAELRRASERFHSFINEIQRMGAAFGSSGVIDGFAHLLSLFTHVGSVVRSVVTAFDGLPGPAKEVVEVLTALRVATLFLSRTRFGASIPGAKYARIPGVDPSYEAQAARAELARGGRQAITSVEQELAQTSSQMTALAAQQAIKAQQAAALQREINASGSRTEEEMAAHNKLAAEILALDKQEVELQGERNAQTEALATLKRQQVGLTGSRGNPNTYSDKEVLALSAATGAGDKALTASAAAQERVAAAQGRLASLERAAAIATGEAAVETEAATVAAREEVAAAELAAEKTGVQAGILSRSASVIGGLGSRLGTFAASLDPLLIAMLALPPIIGSINSQSDRLSQATKAAADLLKKPASQITDLGQYLKDLAAKEGQKAAQENQNPERGPFSGIANWAISNIPGAHAYSKAVGWEESLVGLGGGNQGNRSADSAQLAQGAKALDQLYTQTIDQYKKEGASLIKSAPGRQRLAQEQQRLIEGYQRVAGVLLGSHGDQLPKVMDALKAAFGAAYQNLLPKSGDPQIETASQVEKEIQYLDDYTKVFGGSGASGGAGALRKVASAYSRLIQSIGGKQDSQDLQAIATAQSNIVETVNKRVTDLQHAAQSATTYGGQASSLNQALSVIDQAKAQFERLEQEAIAGAKGDVQAIARIKAAFDQILAQFNDQLKSTIQQQLQLIDTQTKLTASQVSGNSPEADISRAQITLQGLETELAKARSEGADWQVVAGILAQINDARNSLVNLEISNGRAIVQAQSQLAEASITGISPQDDIARAQAAVSSAQTLLAYDQSHGAGEAQILQDQAALDNSIRALNQQMQQRAQQVAQDMAAFIQAQTSLAQSQTLDPIKQAREQLATDVKLLGLIQPNQYATQQQYQTALLQARAKINEDRTKLQEQIIQTDERTLQFEYNTGKIGDQAYINGLQRILQQKKLSLQERQQIEEQIYQLKQGMGKDLSLNVGNIKIPSIYEVRRAIGLGRNGELPGAQNTVINHTASVTVNVYGPRGAAAVGAVLDHHLNTSVRAAMRAKGVA